MKKHSVILEMFDISKSYPGVKALNKANLTLHKGEIHGLVGENGAGKSTLMGILIGLNRPDQGIIKFKGTQVHFNAPKDALNSGITMIHQEISLVPTLSVAENIWLGREDKFKRFGLLSNKNRFEQAKILLDNMGINIDVKKEVQLLSISEMQLVEIARAVSYNADLIIMDEPTSALSNTEIDKLFKIIKDLSQKEVTIVFISHKLDEIFNICHNVTVMRDGKMIETRSISDLTKNQIISLIAGREIKDIFPKTQSNLKNIIFECKNLERKGVFNNISFSVRSGEILGIYGLMGSGRTEIASSIFGIEPLDSGDIIIDGKRAKIKSSSQAIKYGLAMITEDRLRRGVIHGLSVKVNLSLAYIKKICNALGFINFRLEKKDNNKIIKELVIKMNNLDQSINLLSGGNQQKVIIGRWLLTMPKILFMDEPTRGIDVGAKVEVHRLIDKLANRGKAIILISSELPEIMGMCDRILVIRNGEIVYEVLSKEANQEKIVSHAFGM